MTEIEQSSGTRKVVGIGILSAAVILLLGGGAFLMSQGATGKSSQSVVAKEVAKAISLGQEGNFPDALKILERVVENHPDNTDALFNYGLALRSVNKLDESDKAFQKILQLKPDDFEAWAERANLAVLQNDLNRAFDYLEKIPAGKGRLILRLRVDEHWQNLRKHPRMEKIRAIQGLSTLDYD